MQLILIGYTQERSLLRTKIKDKSIAEVLESTPLLAVATKVYTQKQDRLEKVGLVNFLYIDQTYMKKKEYAKIQVCMIK